MKNETYSLYGVTLRPMESDDLELVRSQRNRPEMRQWMTTDHEISKEEMKSWFALLPASSRYWMVEYNGRTVGQANLKGIDNFTADPGYMFWDDDFIAEGGVPRAALALFRIAFVQLGYLTLVGVTAADNTRAIRLAKGLGFRCVSTKEINGKEFVQTSQTREEFEITQKRYEGLFE